MIDAALRTMIDEMLISTPELSGPAVAPDRIQRHVNSLMLAPAASLFDQSALTDRAERLVKAALAAGADTADAVAVRSVSLGLEVRDGAVEESESAEGDDLGLRVLVGQRQAVVSTNDMSGDGSATLGDHFRNR